MTVASSAETVTNKKPPNKKVVNPYAKKEESITAVVNVKNRKVVNPYSKKEVVNPYAKKESTAVVNVKNRKVVKPYSKKVGKRVTFSTGVAFKDVRNYKVQCAPTSLKYFGFVGSLANIVGVKIQHICSVRGLSDSNNYLQRVIKCFTLQRTAMTTLIQAVFELLQQTPSSPAEEAAYFMPVLSCLQSMVFFDTFAGNKASFTVIFGSEDGSDEGVLMHFLRAQRLVARALGFSFKETRARVKHQIACIQNDIDFVAKKINAQNNGTNFAMKIKSSSDDGKNRYLWPNKSDYMVGESYEHFQTLNGGTFPLTKEAWIQFIKMNVKKRFDMKLPRNSGMQLVEDDDGVVYDELSIDAIKRSMI